MSEAYLEGMKTEDPPIKAVPSTESEAYLEGMKTTSTGRLLKPSDVSPKPTSKE